MVEVKQIGILRWKFMRYHAKDRKVAKMERTGLIEENVRTGEKTRA